MELRELYSHGTKLSEVSPHFEGMSLKEWRRLNIIKQCNEYVADQDAAEAPLSKKRIWNPRDSYGMKGF